MKLSFPDKTLGTSLNQEKAWIQNKFFLTSNDLFLILQNKVFNSYTKVN